MNLSILQDSIETMGSREISKLTDKEHKHVIRDIEMLNDVYDYMSLPKVGQCSYKADNGQNYKEYILNQEQCIDLITGYSREIRIKINRRWQELERKTAEPIKPAFQIPQTLGEALQLAANQALQIEQDAPKVSFYNTVAASDVTMTVSDVAKKIGLTAQKLNIKLESIGAYDGRRLPKKIFAHKFIEKGYGVMKLTADGRERNLITQAGQIYIIDLFGGV